jgi:DNA polymerase-3 subunit epsilon
LDALCKRYAIDNSQRTLHGALLDAEILADVYLAMTRQQSSMFEQETASAASGLSTGGLHQTSPPRQHSQLVVLHASADEIAAHRDYLKLLDKSSGGQCLWHRLMMVDP